LLFRLQFGAAGILLVYLLTFCSFVGSGARRSTDHHFHDARLLLAGIGMDTVSGTLRMTFAGASSCAASISVAVIGLFGISEFS